MSGADDTTSAFKRFQELARKLARVPKAELDQERHKPKRSRPTPKSA